MRELTLTLTLTLTPTLTLALALTLTLTLTLALTLTLTLTLTLSPHLARAAPVDQAGVDQLGVQSREAVDPLAVVEAPPRVW